MCYLNSLLLVLFGSSVITFIQNPWTIAFAIVTTILATYLIYKGIKRNKGKGGLQRNLTTTFLVICSFFFGYLIAAYQTHDYFESRTHHMKEESKEQVLLMDDNIDPIMLNPINDYIQTVTEEVTCDCPLHEQLEKEK